ncbi:MAG: hypothetical protein CMO55_01455 [Verrucomicrobiales bacterium]|nr:hypothetical protein [Verrucomicrobiales bacterium]
MQADAIRAQRNQALTTLDTRLERAVEDQDHESGLSLIRNFVDSGILSKQQAEQRQGGFETAFRAKSEQLAIDDAFFLAKMGDLQRANDTISDIDPKRRAQIGEDIHFAFRSAEQERDVQQLLDRRKYRKVAARLARRKPDGRYAHWRTLSDTRRDELLELATTSHLEEIKPVMKEARKRLLEGGISDPRQMRTFFRKRGQSPIPAFEEMMDLELSGRFDTITAKSSFFNRKIDGYEPEEDRGRVRYHNLLAALEVSGLPEGKAGTLAERLTRIADGDTEALEEQYTRREFDRRIAPTVRKTGGRVRADRVKRFDDPERGTIYYTEPTDKERNDPAITIESLRTRGFESEETESEESVNMPLVPEESAPPSPAPEALSNEEAQLEPPESPLTEAEAGITVTDPDIPLSEPAPPIEARVLQLSPDGQAVLNGALLGDEEVTDLIQWDREERMANFLQDKYVTGLQSGKYNSIEAAAKDMGRFVPSGQIADDGKDPLVINEDLTKVLRNALDDKRAGKIVGRTALHEYFGNRGQELPEYFEEMSNLNLHGDYAIDTEKVGYLNFLIDSLKPEEDDGKQKYLQIQATIDALDFPEEANRALKERLERVAQSGHAATNESYARAARSMQRTFAITKILTQELDFTSKLRRQISTTRSCLYFPFDPAPRDRNRGKRWMSASCG